MKHLLCLVAVVCIVCADPLQILSTREEAPVCSTDVCKNAAAQMSQNLDTSVDPCEDFYQFACGGWEAKNPLPPGVGSISVFSKIGDEANRVVKKVLEEAKNCKEPRFINKLKNFYASCINEDQDQDGQWLQNYRDVWPLTSSKWDESFISLEDAVLDACHGEVQTLCDCKIVEHGQSGTVKMLRVHLPSLFSLGSRYTYYEVDRKDPSLMALEDRILEVARKVGVYNEASARDDIAALVDFEQQLALIPFDEDISSVETVTLEDLQLQYSNQVFDWMKFFQSATATPEVGIYDVTPNEPVHRGSAAYFTQLRDLLTATPKRTVVNFIVWRVIDTYWTIAKNRQPGEETRASKEEACLQSIIYETELKYAASRMYLDRAFSEEAKDLLLDIILRIKEAGAELMDELDWIDEETLQQTKEKLYHIQARLGYPEGRYTDAYLENYYSNVSFTRDHYLENLFSVRQDAWRKMVRSLRVTDGPDDLWLFLPTSRNPAGDYRTNSIEIPAAFFQIPYFNRENPESLIYGGMGISTGYLLSAMYSVVGVYFDKFGTFGWWTEAQKESLMDQINQCYAERNNDFFLNPTMKEGSMNLTVDPMLVKARITSDLASLRYAFRALTNLVASQGKEASTLPGLEYTSEQLFFIAKANVHCRLNTEEQAIEDFKLMGQYPAARDRINGLMQNSKEFAQAFNCPADSPMNPPNKCVVW